MLTDVPPKTVSPGRRKPRRPTPAPTPTPTPTPTAPVLVAAAYEVGVAVTMEFDQAIDVGAMSVASVLVDDAPETGWRWEGTGAASLLTPTTVRVELSILGTAVGSDIRLTA